MRISSARDTGVSGVTVSGERVITSLTWTFGNPCLRIGVYLTTPISSTVIRPAPTISFRCGKICCSRSSRSTTVITRGKSIASRRIAVVLIRLDAPKPAIPRTTVALAQPSLFKNSRIAR
jgi:hypothetical protein